MSACILWKGRTKKGYGIIVDKQRQYAAHRLAYVLANNLSLQDIAGLVIRHTCDNPLCVNPEHLIPGTHQDNMDDMRVRGRSTAGSKNPGAILTDEQVSTIRETTIKGDPVNGVRAKALEYDVAKSTISNIINRKRWK